MMRTPLQMACLLALAGCATIERPSTLDGAVRSELEAVGRTPISTRPARAVEQALLPPLNVELPRIDGKALEPRFDLSVRQAPAQQVFMSIVSGTRYSMLVHPDVSGQISVSLKDVTVKEALDSLRDLYGYEYQVDGTRILVQPVAMQTRVFQVNYLIGQRQGRTDIQVTSGISGSAPGGGAGGVPGGAAPAGGAAPGMAGAGVGGGASAGGGALGARPGTSSQIATVTRNDFWGDLQETLRAIVGAPAGGAAGAGAGFGANPGAPGGAGSAEAPRSVVVNAQAGVIVVRAMPKEIRAVEQYLRAIRLAVERQVMIEAKIVEVTLGDAYQAGVNWAAFGAHQRIGGGMVGPGTTIVREGTTLTNSVVTVNNQARSVGVDLGSPPGIFPLGNGTLLGLAFQTSNFATLLQFLESQGTAQVLSSPRIAALNNQKAVLKVGTEEYFVTNVSGGTAPATGGTTAATTTLPTLTIQPFFSGVALDVLPQIDDDGSVILHVRPTVSSVEQDNRTVNLGSAFGQITLPTARSTASETDSIVRVQDGNIVAIGGLMKVDVLDQRSGVPGMQESIASGLFGARKRQVVKKELVVLIKPTVVRGDYELNDDARRTMDRLIDQSGQRGFVRLPGATP